MSYFPTETDLTDALQRSVKILDDAFTGEGDGAGSAYDNVQDLLTNVSYPGDGGLRNAAVGFRTGLSASILSLGRTLLDRVFAGFLTLAGKPAGPSGVLSRWADVVEYWRDNGLWIDSQSTTRAFAKTGGTGVVNANILNYDAYGYFMESADPGVAFVTVDSSGTAASPGDCSLSFRRIPKIDLFSYLHRSDTPPEYYGPETVPSFVLRNTSGLPNGDFWNGQAVVAKGSLSNLASWVDGDGASFAKLALVEDGYRQNSAAATFYRGAPSSRISKLCLEADDVIDIWQPIRINRSTAYHAGVWLKNTNSATGSVTLTVGAISRVIDIATVSTSWEFYPLVDPATPSNTKNYWGLNLETSDARFRINITSIATGELRISNCLWSPRTQFNGAWIHLEPGDTFVENDYEATFTSSIAVTGKIGRQLNFVYGNGAYLPATNNSVSMTASGGRTLTFANATSTITASSGSFVTDGYQIGMDAVTDSPLNAGRHRITLVTATVLTVESTLTDEGPLSATTTLYADASVPDPS